MAGRSAHRGNRHSWRNANRSLRQRKARATQRWTWLLFACGLIVLFGYFMWHLFLPGDPATHLIAIGPGKMDLLVLPSISFQTEPFRGDLAQPPTSADELSSEAPPNSPSWLDLTDVAQTTTDFGHLADTIASQTESNDDDVVVLYWNGFALAIDGKPRLTCRSFDLGSRTSEHIGVDELIEQIVRVPAKYYVVALDLGHLDGDPRLGSLMDDMPLRISEVLSQMEANDRVWVVVSNASGERSTVSYRSKANWFARSLVDAMAGAADSVHMRGADEHRSDRFVNLDELLHYLHLSCAEGSAGQQTVWWQQPGRQRLEPTDRLPDLEIAYLGPPTEPSESEDSESEASESENATTDPDPPSPEPLQPPWHATLRECWEIRDRLDARSGSQWAPIEFAPHLWRRQEARLVALEQRARGGDVYASSIGAEIEDERQQLRGLEQSLETNRPSATANELTHRIVAAHQQFLRDPSGAQPWSAVDPSWARLPRAKRWCGRAIYRARDHVAWYTAYGARHDSADAAWFASLTRYLRQLAELRRAVDATETRPDSTSRSGLTQAWQAAEESERELQQRLAQQTARATLPTRPNPTQSTSPGDASFNEATLREAEKWSDVVLSTPLVRAVDRVRLQQQLVSLSDRYPVTTPPEPFRWDDPLHPWPDKGWLAEHRLELEQLAISAEIEPSGTFNIPSNAEAITQFYRTDYQTLITQPDGDRHRARGWLSDPRDEYTMETDVLLLPRLIVADPIRARGIVITRSPDGRQVVLKEPGKPESLDLTLRALDPAITSVTPKLRYNTSLLRIEVAGQAIPADTEVTVASGARWPLEVVAVANRVTAQQRATTLEIITQTPGDQNNAKYTIEFALPAPDDLVVDVTRNGASIHDAVDRGENSVPSGIDRQFIQSDGVQLGLRLRPYPGRTTTWHWTVENPTQVAREITGRLIAVPVDPADRRTLPTGFILHRPSGEGDWQPSVDIERTLFQRRNRRWELIVPDQVVATIDPLELPPESQTPLTFRSPGNGGSGPDGSAPDAASAGGPLSSIVDLSAGLVLELTDVTRDKRWHKWIEMRPWHAHNYMRVSVGQVVDGKIPFQVELDDPPDDLATDPIDVRVRFFGADRHIPLEEQEVIGLVEQAINTPDGASWEITVEPQRALRRVVATIDVDQTPRGFQYDIPLDGKGRDRGRGANRVAFTSLSDTPPRRIYWDGTGPSPIVSAVGSGEGAGQLEVLPLTTDQFAVFRAGRSESVVLQVALQVDAPYDTFVDPGLGDKEMITIRYRLPGGSDRVVKRLRSPFAEQVTLRQLAGNVVQVDATVSDHRFALPTQGFATADLAATLQTRLDRRDAEPIHVVCDANPPRVTRGVTDPEGPVKQGQTVRLFLAVDDLSGIRVARFQLARRADQPLAIDQATSARITAPGKPGDDWQIEVELPTNDPPVDRPTPMYVIGAIEDVAGHELTLGGPSRQSLSPIRVDILPAVAAAAASGDSKPERAPFKEGTIRGQLILGSSPLPSAAVNPVVRIAGEKFSQQIAASNGQFIFRNVPAGEYVLEASAIIGGGTRAGKLENVKLLDHDDNPRVVQVVLE